jgi:cation diffusion facilitator CzcD-associated flavoprotein CzcO
MSSPPQIVIVGAGFGGIAAAIELRRHGFDDVTILEGASDLGGTWFYNSYPGAACDVPSHLYSFSYEQRTSWSRLCSPQQEILSYLHDVARDHGVMDAIRFSQRVRDCAFDPVNRRWAVETQPGERYDADVLILATGQLNRPSIPDLPGRDGFAGHSFHSARWDHDYDLRGKRVAVVGTGASAVQFVPEVARQAAQPRLPAAGASRDPPRSRAAAPAPQLPLQLLREPHPGHPPPADGRAARRNALGGFHAPPAPGPRGACASLA